MRCFVSLRSNPFRMGYLRAFARLDNFLSPFACERERERETRVASAREREISSRARDLERDDDDRASTIFCASICSLVRSRVIEN